MQNVTEQYDSSTALIEEDPFNRGSPCPVYLSLDWDSGIVDIRSYYADGTTLSDVWHGLRSIIRIPETVDATNAKQDVETLMPRIQKIAEGFSAEWDGHNQVGSWTTHARDLLDDLISDLDEDKVDQYFTILTAPAGLWEANTWFVDAPDEITATMSDDDIYNLAVDLESEASHDNVVICGGVPAIVKRFEYFREKLQDNLIFFFTLPWFTIVNRYIYILSPYCLYIRSPSQTNHNALSHSSPYNTTNHHTHQYRASITSFRL